MTNIPIMYVVTVEGDTTDADYMGVTKRITATGAEYMIVGPLAKALADNVKVQAARIKALETERDGAIREVGVWARRSVSNEARIKALEAERDEALREKAAAHGLALGAGKLAERERNRADAAEARIKALEDGLREIADYHIPDCPAHFSGDELAWAHRQHGHLRQIARALLGASALRGGSSCGVSTNE